MERRQWSIRQTLVFAFGGMVLLVCLLAVAHYAYDRTIQRGNDRIRFVFGSMSVRALTMKEAMMLAHNRLLEFFANKKEDDWEVCRLALNTFKDEADSMSALLHYGDVGRDLPQLMGSIEQNLEMYGTLSRSGRAQAQLTATARKRFFDFVSRPGLHSLRSLDALLESALHQEPGAPKMMVEQSNLLHAISSNISQLRGDAIRAMLTRDIRLMEQGERYFADIHTNLAGLRATDRYAHVIEALEHELAQYRELHTNFYNEWLKLNEVVSACDTTGSRLLGEASALMEAIGFLQESAVRAQYKEQMRIRMLIWGLYAVVLALLAAAAQMLYSKLSAPLRSLSEFAEHSAYSRQPVPQSGVFEVDTAVRRVADMAAVRNKQIGKALAENRKAQEAALAARNDSAAKTAFMARMSHELRTPMNSILGMSYLFGKTSLNSKQQNYLANISASAKNILSILDDILNFLRLESDTVSLEFRAFSLHDFMAALRETYTAAARAKGLSLSVVIEPDLPSVLWGDATRIGQVLHNMLDNAIKYTTEGSVEISVRQADVAMSDPAWMAVHFSVKDSGIGLSRDLLEQLNQQHGSEDDIEIPRKFGESGLGLALCRRLVHLMRGSYWGESVSGEGSTFHCIIPCGLDGSGDMTGMHRVSIVAENPVSVEAGHDASEPDLQGFSVLLVEDNILNQEICTELLTNCGLDVTTVQDGEGAVELVDQRPFDLVLMDIQMPGMSGYDATRHIRALGVPWAQGLPVVAMTAHGLDSDRERSREAGMQEHLVKPVEPAALYAVLRTWLTKEPKHDALLTHAEESMSALDVSLGLHHLNGNEQLYNKLLRRFADSNAGVAQEIRTAMAGGDTETAIRVAHTLKGVAASLGAPTLSEAALEAEQVLKGGVMPEDDLAGLEAELARVLAAIEERLG